jgi:hypothetical protein
MKKQWRGGAWLSRKEFIQLFPVIINGLKAFRDTLLVSIIHT